MDPFMHSSLFIKSTAMRKQQQPTWRQEVPTAAELTAGLAQRVATSRDVIDAGAFTLGAIVAHSVQ